MDWNGKVKEMNEHLYVPVLYICLYIYFYGLFDFWRYHMRIKHKDEHEKIMLICNLTMRKV